MRLIDTLNGHVDPQALKKHLLEVARNATNYHATVPGNWMPATGCRALCMDSVVDVWLEFHGSRHGLTKDPRDGSFLDFLGKQGGRMEDVWIKTVIPDHVRVLEEDWEARGINAFVKSLVAMTSDAPALWKCAIWWAGFGVYGACDYLVRSDIWYSLFPEFAPDEPEPIHWLVVDSKLTAGITDSRNSKKLSANKAQLAFYSAIVANLQGYAAKRAFLVCRDRPMNPIAIELDYEVGQPLPSYLADLRDQYLRIKLEGEQMTPWTHAEIAPNFSHIDSPWVGAKKKLAKLMKPLSLLPSVGANEERQLADLGYHSLDDVLTSDRPLPQFRDIKGIGDSTAKRIEAVIMANRDNRPFFGEAWEPLPKYDLTLFVDFEAVNGLNIDWSKFPVLSGTAITTMIGTGLERRGKFEYHQWQVNEESEAAEKQMFEDWLSWIDRVSSGRHVGIVHWSKAEPVLAARAAERHGLDRLKELPFFDLLARVFRKAPVGMPGAMGWSLKDVMSSIRQISPDYGVSHPEELHDGLSAMLLTWEALAQPEPWSSPQGMLLTAYLRADVESTYAIWRWALDHAPKPSVTSAVRRGWWYRPEIICADSATQFPHSPS